jgi:DNA polymerase-1
MFNQNTYDSDGKCTSVVIHADFSTAELRAGCSIMKDEQMYSELKAGTDLHKIAATLALGGKPEDITKEQRQKGKAISFGFIFGMSASGFQEYAYVNYGVVFTPEECVAIKAAYVKRYKQINSYAKDKWNTYKTEPVDTPLGHRAKARLGTDAINHATQGAIAETTKLAVHYLVKEDERALGYIFNVVHDALYLRVNPEEVEYWAKLILKNMKKGWSEMCKTPLLYYKDIPMPVELEYTCPETGKHIVIEE